MSDSTDPFAPCTCNGPRDDHPEHDPGCAKLHDHPDRAFEELVQLTEEMGLYPRPRFDDDPWGTRPDENDEPPF